MLRKVQGGLCGAICLFMIVFSAVADPIEPDDELSIPIPEPKSDICDSWMAATVSGTQTNCTLHCAGSAPLRTRGNICINGRTGCTVANVTRQQVFQPIESASVRRIQKLQCIKPSVHRPLNRGGVTTLSRIGQSLLSQGKRCPSVCFGLGRSPETLDDYEYIAQEFQELERVMDGEYPSCTPEERQYRVIAMDQAPDTEYRSQVLFPSESTPDVSRVFSDFSKADHTDSGKRVEPIWDATADCLDWLATAPEDHDRKVILFTGKQFGNRLPDSPSVQEIQNKRERVRATISVIEPVAKTNLSWVHLSKDGKKLLASSWGGDSFGLWNAETGEPLKVFSHRETAKEKVTVRRVGFTNDNVVYSTPITGSLVFWNDDASVSRVIPGDPNQWANVVFSNDGQSLALVGKEKVVQIWPVPKASDEPTTKPKGEIQSASYPGGYTWMNFSSDGKKLAVTRNNQSVVNIWNLGTNMLETPIVMATPTFSAVLSPDGTNLAVIMGGALRSVVEVWNLSRMEKVGAFDIKEKKMADTLDFSPDGTKVLIASTQSQANSWLALWDFSADPMGERALTRIFLDTLHSVTFTESGDRIFVTLFTPNSFHAYVTVLPISNVSQDLFRIEGHADFDESSPVSGDGSKIVTYEYNTGLISVFDLPSGKPIVKFDINRDAPCTERIFLDGSRQVSGYCQCNRFTLPDEDENWCGLDRVN